MNSKDLVHELNALYFPITKSTDNDQLREPELFMRKKQIVENFSGK